MSISRLTFIFTSRRRSPSTFFSLSMISRIRLSWSSVRSFTPRVAVDAHPEDDLLGEGQAYPVDTPQGYLHPLVVWDVDSGDQGHGYSSFACRLPAGPIPVSACVWGFSQTTYTRLFRRIILHFAQRVLTDAETFTATSLEPIRNSSPGEVIGRQLYQHTVSRQHAYKVEPDLA